MLNLDPYGHLPRQCFCPPEVAMDAMVDYAIKVVGAGREDVILVHAHGYAVVECNHLCKLITRTGSQQLTQPAM